MQKVANYAIACIFAAISFACGANAAEIIILTNQGAVSAVRDLAPAFEKASGHKVIISFLYGPAMNQAIESGAPADLASSFFESFEDLVKRGKVVSGAWAEYARAGNGVAVKAGAAKPDISTPEAFKQAMLGAKSIGHSGQGQGTGPYNTKMFQKLGIYEQIKDKIKIIEGRTVAIAVAAGEVEIGLQQTNVIQPVEGTSYLGPLPASLMEYGRYGVGLLSISKQPDAARAFMAFMTSPEAAPLIRKSAMEPPAK